MAGAQEAQGGSGLRSVTLSEGGEVEGTVAQERAEQSGAQQREVARAASVAAQFGIFAPGDVTAVMVGAFHAPMAAAACEPLAGGERRAFCGGDEQTGLATGEAGFLVGGLTVHGDNGRGMRKAELHRHDRREHQRAVLGAAMGAVVG